MSTKITNIGDFRVATSHNPYVESVTVSVGVKVGSRNETKALNGISHFLEHMAFKGTETKNAQDIANIIENVGGYMNAYTSQEKTVYYIKVLKENLETAVEILADIMQNSTFDKDELETERGVILQELSASLDNPSDVIFDYFTESCFGDTPLGRTILGPAENISSFTRENFFEYIGANYHASNMVLSIAGNVEHEKAVDLASKYFTKLSKGKCPTPEKGDYIGGSINKDNQELSQLQFAMGFKSGDIQSPDRYKLSILNKILGAGMSSRLFQEIREKRGLVYTISSFIESYADTGIFGIYAGTSPDKVEELSYTLMDELKKSCSEIHDDEFQRAINQYKSSLLMSKESTTSVSHRMAHSILNYDRVIDDSELLTEIGKVTISDVQDLLKSILATTPTLATYGKTGSVPPLATLQERLN